MAKWTGKKCNVMFTKPEEPSFLKAFKEKVGYKEDKGLSEKFEEMPKATDEDVQDRDDELPQVIQLKPGDLSQEEYDTMLKSVETATRNEVTKDEEGDVGGKILFRQPTLKRNRDTGNELKASTKKSKKSPQAGEGEEVEEEVQDLVGEELSKKKKRKEKSNKTLLSFNEEEDAEDT